MISIIITTYNRRAFLKAALLSVINQDYRDKEIIVVDDGSNDGSREEIREFPIRYIWKKNGGISSARNCGIELSKGEYISFLDVDDLWLKGKLSKQMEQMEKDNFLISYTDEIWTRNGKRLNQKLRHKKYTGHIFERCLPLCIISPSSVVVKKEVFDNIGFFDESMSVCEDYDMWLRITARYPVLFVDVPLIIKQGGHADQLSKSVKAMDRFRIKSIVKIIKSDALTDVMKKAAIAELHNKLNIYMNGAKKRGKIEEMQGIMELVKDVIY
ncbi:MAG TPA: glycosyltransferase [Syntrophorhabdaceae bacterium]|jgi:glycosyltransferase involved in cell wall biosynthesis|nr:glycosyltransferase [Syntrophorhabdaceae bacterium]HPL40270.1 glycosyltransferase [Syntrophorhabdaceae bacterium]